MPVLLRTQMPRGLLHSLRLRFLFAIYQNMKENIYRNMALQDPVNEEITFAFYQTLGNPPPLIRFFSLTRDSFGIL